MNPHPTLASTRRPGAPGKGASAAAAVCAVTSRVVDFTRRGCSCLPTLPANAAAGLVALKRPVTFLVALLTALLAALASSVFSLTRLEPPSCPLEEPRTRPRPSSHAFELAEPLTGTYAPVRGALETLSSLVKGRLGRSAGTSETHPPVSHAHVRGTQASPNRYAYHELDGVEEDVDAEEGEEAHAATTGRSVAVPKSPTPSRSSTDPGSLPALTPDGGSELGSDDLSDLEHAELAPDGGRSKAPKRKGLAILTAGFHKWKRTPSYERSLHLTASPEGEAPASAGPDAQVAPVAHASSGSSRYLHALRHRASTITLPHGPALPSTIPRPPQRRQASDPVSHAPEPSLAGPPPSLPDTAPPKRKRAQTSLFFRSLSRPGAKSPEHSPPHSPPTSPQLSAPPAFPSGTRRGSSPIRSQILDVSKSTGIARERESLERGRRPALGRHLVIPSPPLSRQTIDIAGHSGLRIGDFVR